MDFFSPQFFSALLTLVIIDLVLAGDNAIVIGLAARNLPKHQQKQAIFWGATGAVAIRALATLVVVWLLKIPGLLALGGILLIWIAYKLLVDDKCHDVKECNSLWSAIRTIIIADAVMGIDNVLAIAGAAHGDFMLVLLGLVISVPIIIWGSTLILKLIERYPIIVDFGAGVLAFTAAKMIISEPLLKSFVKGYSFIEWFLVITIIAGVIISGRLKRVKLSSQG